MILNRVKPWQAVTFMKYLASADFFKFLPKNLIWNKITLSIANLLNLAALVVNERMKCLYKKVSTFHFLPDLTLLNPSRFFKNVDNFAVLACYAATN